MIGIKQSVSPVDKIPTFYAWKDLWKLEQMSL